MAAVVFPVSSRHQGSCLLIAAHHDISTISQYLVQHTSASAVVLRRGTVQCYTRHRTQCIACTSTLTPLCRNLLHQGWRADVHLHGELLRHPVPARRRGPRRGRRSLRRRRHHHHPHPGLPLHVEVNKHQNILLHKYCHTSIIIMLFFLSTSSTNFTPVCYVRGGELLPNLQWSFTAHQALHTCSTPAPPHPCTTTALQLKAHIAVIS